MTDEQRALDSISRAVATGDKGGIADSLAVLAEHVPADGALSGEVLAGLAILRDTYGDLVDPARLNATLGITTPEAARHAAWNLEGRGYEGTPQTGAEYAERVALIIAMLYSDGLDEDLDFDRVIGKGRDLFPDLISLGGFGEIEGGRPK